MIEEQAIVVGVEGDSARLEIKRNSPCGLCGSTGGCGASLWGRWFGQRSQGFFARNVLEVSVGEYVIIGVDESALLRGSLIAYLIPLLLSCLMAWFGASLASARATSDGYAVIGAMLGLLLGLAWARFHTAGKQQGPRYQPQMLRRAEQGSIRQCSKVIK
jgi:sigma-E factor negative regulatory protein RseC